MNYSEVNLIPKVIHYCWFGRQPLPISVKDCIQSWEKYLPEYEIIEWNEDNFDLGINSFAKEAYDSQKYAFVTDYVRLHVLYHFGGIYMDTDVEILRSVNQFLVHPAFSGFENENYIPTAIMGSHKKNKWIEILLNYYENRKFILDDGKFDTTTNVKIISNLSMKNFDVKMNNTFQNVEGVFVLYPKDFFCPKSYKTGKINLTENTHAIHHFSGSWLDSESIKKRKHNHQIGRIFGERIGNLIINVRDIYKKEGLIKLIRTFLLKMRG